jgi:hypothetical protein
MSVSDIERIVRERYGEGAREQVAELCCPVDYDPKFLEVIPREVLERDYGCGDPSRHLRAGEVVAEAAQPFDCSRDTMRQPQETKGENCRATDEGDTYCGLGECC